MTGVLDILLHGSEQWLPQLVRHVQLSIAAIVLAIAIGVPAGAAITRHERWAFATTSTANLGRTIPSLAVLALVYPVTGTGYLPALIALVVLAIPPILVATWSSIRAVDADVVDAARGLGLSSHRRLLDIELPMAAPLIIGGIRTASVQVVASATLAALIGGGGLGEMVLAGLTNLRTDLLLTGALLVAGLALATEAVFVLGEQHLLPAGVRALAAARTAPGAAASGSYRASGALDGRRWRAVIVGAAIGCGALLGMGSMASSVVARIGAPDAPAAQGNLPTIRIGSKDFTEQVVLGELYAQALEGQGYRVERHLNLGATAVADAALRRGEIDMYPEYTGTSLTAVLKQTPKGTDSADDVLRAVRAGYDERGMQVLDQTPFSNGNAIVVSQAIADKHDLHTMSDLARVASKLRFASIPGFDTREDGLPLLAKTYGIRFKTTRSYDNGLKYQALADGKVDAAYGFETDGQIARHNLITLTDDKHAWPPYHAAPIITDALARSVGPDFAATIDAVNSMLDAGTMRRLNDEVDTGKQDPADVARAALRTAHLA